MSANKLQTYLNQYVKAPLSPDNNFWLAYEYEKIGQNAAALSYYLRCAEISKDRDLVYECLLKSWLMLNRTGRREWYEHQQLLTAITQHPKRPEAYFLLSRYHEYKEEWKECYYYASVGLELCDFNLPKLRTDVDYPGEFALLFQKAFSSWYVGQRKLSQQLWLQLSQRDDLYGKYKELAASNLKDLNLKINLKKDNQLDIVLQGKYSEYVLETAKHYLELKFVNKVIISCWVDDVVPTLDSNKIVFIQNNYPAVNGTGNRNLQIVSSYGGLKHVTTDFAIKMRNDQRYDIDSMNNMYKFFNDNKERIVTFEGDKTKPKNRILVAGMFEGFPFHPRDHVFWGHKEDLLDIFDMPLEPIGIEDRVKMKREDYWKYYDCYIRTESYIGSHYASKFDERIKKWLLKPEQYLYDDAPKHSEALNLSDKLSKQIFKSFPKEGIDLVWDKYNWNNYPYDSQYSRFNERWHEDGY